MDSTPEPTNDHERTIAEALDRKMLAPATPCGSIVSEVVESMPFELSIADIQFLLNYAHWRFPQPAKKKPTRGTSSKDLKRSG